MSTLKVGGIRGVSASSDAITVANDGTATGKFTNIPNRNLIINGAMLVAQRGTSSTSEGYQTIDRFYVGSGGTDEAQTQAQVDVASGTTPYTLGFRKALKITNGNQTSGAGAGDFMYMKYVIEAQDIANSGWNYLSSSSYITLSFWVKSSVAQSFKGYLITQDGTAYLYPFDTGSLSADTWTKVTKTIPGNSNLTFNNDTGSGLELYIWPFIGTDYTAGSVTEDAWATYSSSARTKDATSTWYTTNDATFEITGVQLEVGSVVTDFEHRSYGDELLKCQRYYEELHPRLLVLARYSHHDGGAYAQYHFKVEKRAAPTCTSSGTFQTSTGYSGSPSFSDTLKDSTDIYSANSVVAGGILYLHNNSNGICHFSAEL